MADLEPRQPGYFDCKEGWYEWDGQGKHEEECFAGQTMGCIRLMISDNNVACDFSSVTVALLSQVLGHSSACNVCGQLST